MNELAAIRKTLRTSDLAIAEVARRAGVKPRWLQSLAAGNMTDPGYSKVLAVKSALDSIMASKY